MYVYYSARKRVYPLIEKRFFAKVNLSIPVTWDFQLHPCWYDCWVVCGEESMTKGKTWSLEDEKKLKDWVNSGVSVDALVFSFGGQYT